MLDRSTVAIWQRLQLIIIFRLGSVVLEEWKLCQWLRVYGCALDSGARFIKIRLRVACSPAVLREGETFSSGLLQMLIAALASFGVIVFQTIKYGKAVRTISWTA